MSFDTFNAEVDRQVFSLRAHRFDWWWTYFGGRWRWVCGCTECGLKWEHYREKQLCLGVIGELMLAGEKVPARWTHNFAERVRVARRAWKAKSERAKTSKR